MTGSTNIKAILLIALGAILSLPVCAQDRSTAMNDVVLWYDVFNKRDPAQLTRILSEDWVDIPAAPMTGLRQLAAFDK